MNTIINQSLPLVSVIIPFYDRVHLMLETLESVKNQQYQNIEIILVNDNSKPGWQTEIEDRFQGNLRYRFINNQKQLGTGLSRQAGLEASRGEYILYLDSDDILHPEMVRRCIILLEEKEGVGMCYVVSREFSKLADIENPATLKISNRSNLGITENIIYESWTRGRIWDTAACVWRKSAICHFEPWESIRYEDYIYESQIDAQGINIGFINETLCFYRIHENNLSKLETDIYQHRIHALIRITDFLAKVQKKQGLKIFIYTRLIKLLLRYKNYETEAFNGAQDPFAKMLIARRKNTFALKLSLFFLKIFWRSV